MELLRYVTLFAWNITILNPLDRFLQKYGYDIYGAVNPGCLRKVHPDCVLVLYNYIPGFIGRVCFILSLDHAKDPIISWIGSKSDIFIFFGGIIKIQYILSSIAVQLDLILFHWILSTMDNSYQYFFFICQEVFYIITFLGGVMLDQKGRT